MPSPAVTDERQPLLHQNEVQDSAGKPRIRQRFVDGAASLRTFLLDDPILICTFCLQFCTYFSKHMVEVPIIKLFEQAICDRYYAAHIDALASPIHERYCKIPEIQNELASLVGWKFTFDALPGRSSIDNIQVLWLIFMTKGS